MKKNDEELIKKYLAYKRKKKIVISITLLILTFLIGISVCIYYWINKNEPYQESTNDNIVNENTIEETTSTNNTETSIVPEETQEEVIEKTEEINSQSKENITNAETTKSTVPKNEKNVSSPKVETKKQSKPPNKDFLFSDGFNMQNVSQAAQDYLKSSGYSGKCLPLKDDEGIYIGMRVIFD